MQTDPCKIIGLLFAVVLCAAPAPAAAALCEGWDTTDTVMAAAFGTALTTDILSTRRGLKEPGGRELNPVLGQSPSDRDLAFAWLAASVGYTAGACLLPKRQREWWGAFWIGVEAHATWRNAVTIGWLRTF